MCEWCYCTGWLGTSRCPSIRMICAFRIVYVQSIYRPTSVLCLPYTVHISEFALPKYCYCYIHDQVLLTCFSIPQNGRPQFQQRSSWKWKSDKKQFLFNNHTLLWPTLIGDKLFLKVWGWRYNIRVEDLFQATYLQYIYRTRRVYSKILESNWKGNPLARLANSYNTLICLEVF